MKLLSMLAAIALFSSVTKAQIKRAYHKNAHLKYEVNTRNGLLNGTYTSWYPNGQKKAEGEFQNNQRMGTWKVWSPLGILKTHRNYQNAYQFTILTQQDDNGESLSIPKFLVYELMKNEMDYIEYPNTDGKDVCWQKNIWRKIEKNATNAPLFSGQTMDVLLKELSKNKTISIYKPSFDKAKVELNAGEREKLLKQKEETLVGFYIKEVAFFDLARQLSENRIFQICPIVKSKEGDKEKALFWLSYEEIRPLFAQQKVSVVGNSMIETLEDWLHFRHFQSTIEKESNAYDRKIEAYATGNAFKKEQERIEMQLLDREHDLWLLQEVN